MVILNQKGFSIAQVLIASGIALAISLGSFQLILNSQNSEQSLQSTLGKINLQQDIQRITSEEAVCTSKLSIDPSDKNLNSGSAKLFIETGGVNVSLNDKEAASLYSLSNVEILYENITLVDTLLSGNLLYHGIVKVNSDKKSNLMGGKQNNVIEVGELMVEVDSSLNLQSCYSEISVAGSCQNMGGTYDSSATPKCVVPPACPSGQILVSQGENKPGKCQNPPIKIVRVPTPPMKTTSTPSKKACDVNPDICQVYIDNLGKYPDLEGIQYWNAYAVGNQYQPGMDISTVKGMILDTAKHYGVPVKE
jgi:hypothetical protein